MGFQSGPIGRTLRIAAVAVVGLAALEGVARAQNVGIFQSAVSSDANLGGLAGADARCELEGTTVIPGSGPWWPGSRRMTVAPDPSRTPGTESRSREAARMSEPPPRPLS